MKLKIALTNIIFSLLGYVLYAQEIPKDTLYFLFEKNINEDKFYSAKEKGIIFNFSNPIESFLFQDILKSDTLDIKQFHNYKLVSLNQIEEIDKDWEIKNTKTLK